MKSLLRHLQFSAQAKDTHSESLSSLTCACIDGLCQNRHGVSLVEFDGTEVSRARILTGACLFASAIRRGRSDRVGIILPSGAGATVANLAVLMCGKVPVNLNYTANMTALKSAVEKAGVRQIYSSSRFVHKLYQRGIDLNQLNDQQSGVKLLYMEDIRAGFSKMKQLFALLLATCMPAFFFHLRYVNKPSENETAILLFSSGSEGRPKGVELSHDNIISNIKQVSEVLNPQSDEVLVSSLPPFHAFGLTVTLFMPLVEGIKTVCQPDPVNARGTAKLISDHKATILLGTSTFLRLYIQDKKIQPEMLKSLRIVVAGAEKLREDVRSGFKLKFCKDIQEGYGCTETSPVSAVNRPDEPGADSARAKLGQRPGSVGIPLPRTQFKVVDPDTFNELAINQEGMVIVAGPQVMKGYLDDPEKTHEVIKEMGGLRWYVTGDKGRIDADGFLWIVDRYSRFAKIGGEMVSLGAVEGVAEQVVSDLYENLELPPEVMATSMPDKKKGEVVVILATAEMDLKTLRSRMMDKGVNSLMLPEKIKVVDELPKLGTGKPDYHGAKQLVLSP